MEKDKDYDVNDDKYDFGDDYCEDDYMTREDRVDRIQKIQIAHDDWVSESNYPEKCNEFDPGDCE